jgi:hypothetical protein
VSPEKLFYFSLGSQPLKNRTRGFFVVRQIAKIFLRKTVFEKNRERQQFFESMTENRWGEMLSVCGFDAPKKNSFKSHFFYMINELFYCIKSQRAVNLTSFHKFPNEEKS